MTKEEFIAQWGGPDMTPERMQQILERFTPMECWCGAPNCTGWAMIAKGLEERHLSYEGVPPEKRGVKEP